MEICCIAIDFFSFFPSFIFRHMVCSLSLSPPFLEEENKSMEMGDAREDSTHARTQTNTDPGNTLLWQLLLVHAPRFNTSTQKPH